MEKRFEICTKIIESLPSDTPPLTNHQKLQLYALYKQATIGKNSTPLTIGKNTTKPAPSIFEYSKYKKWEAWRQIEGYEREEAMEEYIDLVLKYLRDNLEKDERLLEHLRQLEPTINTTNNNGETQFRTPLQTPLPQRRGFATILPPSMNEDLQNTLNRLQSQIDYLSNSISINDLMYRSREFGDGTAIWNGWHGLYGWSDYGRVLFHITTEEEEFDIIDMVLQQKVKMRDLEWHLELYQDFPTDKATQIINLTSTQLQNAVLNHEFSYEDVMKAYCKAAYEIHQYKNCITEVLFKSAIEKARQLDLQRSSAGSSSRSEKGILYGLPISIKDHINLQNYDSSMGIENFCLKPKNENALLVQRMEEEGGIVFCKTNLSQAMSFFECYNPVWGRTLHPLYNGYTPGGSTGGEAVLLAMKGSILGVGSDSGGSLRIPAHFCGVYSLKPTFGRVPMSGVEGYQPHTGIALCIGPIARDVDALELFFRAMTNRMFFSSCEVVPLKYREVKLKSRMRVGYYLNDGFVQSMPCCQRAVESVIDYLKKEGHDVIQIDPKDLKIYKLIELFFSLSNADQCESLRRDLNGTKVENCLWKMMMAIGMPNWFKSMIAWYYEYMIGSPEMALIIRSLKKRSILEIHDLLKEQERLKNELTHYLRHELKLDFIVCPPLAHPTIINNTFEQLSFSCSYSIIYNVLDYTVGTMPVTRVDKELDQLKEEPKRWIDKESVKYYEAPIHSPVGVQIVGIGSYQEEFILKVMKYLVPLINYK